MGVEGKDKAKVLEAGAAALAGQLGRTIAKLRKDYGLSLADLSTQSGVAKSIISQIERNETIPPWRRSGGCRTRSTSRSNRSCTARKTGRSSNTRCAEARRCWCPTTASVASP